MLARRLWRAVPICSGILAVLYVMALAFLVIEQRTFLYAPAGAAAAPSLSHAQVLSLSTIDGERLRAWYVPAAQDKPLLLFFHGNGGSIETFEDTLKALVAPGNGVLAIEYRGYPGSSGSPSETGLIADAQAAYDKVRALGYAPQRLIAFGESLGTGVAIAMASHNEVGGVVLISPYDSVADVAASAYWMFPTSYLIWDSFRSDQRIGAIKAPLLIVHGTDDTAIPIRFARRLFEGASEPKRFITIERGGHLPIAEAMPEVLAWIARAK